MQHLLAHHLAFGLDPMKVVAFCQQHAFELRVWAARTSSDPDDRLRCALSLSHGDLEDEGLGGGNEERGP
jgi:hypothetical protein